MRLPPLLRRMSRRDHWPAIGICRNDKQTDTRNSTPSVWNIYSSRVRTLRGNSYRFLPRVVCPVSLSTLMCYSNKEIPRLHSVHNCDSLLIAEYRDRILLIDVCAKGAIALRVNVFIFQIDRRLTL